MKRLILLTTILIAFGCTSAKVSTEQKLKDTITKYITLINQGEFKAASQMGIKPDSFKWVLIIAQGEGKPLATSKQIQIIHIEIDYIRETRAAVDIELNSEEGGYIYTRMILKRDGEVWKIVSSIKSETQ